LAAAPLSIDLRSAIKKATMPIRLDSSSADFRERFGTFLAAKREASADVERATRAIVDDVAARGDAALIEATRKFDRLDIDASGLRVTAAEIDAAVKACDRETLDALKFARDRIELFHRRQLPKDERFTDALGVELGWRWSAIDAVGLYVPGGTAAYPSSVLMNAVPANVAGVARVVMVVPSPDGKLNPLVLAAAHLGGVSEIYRVGGAQAVAALAWGTATIAPVAKIVGPGNAYVAAAKRLVFGKVGIDMIAGPSEVLVIADRTGNAGWIAADLLAQAEHDASAQSILITDDVALADEVARAVESQLTTLPRAKIARASWNEFGAIIMVRNLDDAAALANEIAAEHLEIMTADPEALSAKVQCRCDLPGIAHARGNRGLCRRFQSRAAHRALGAVLVRPRRARLHEAHLDPQMRTGSAARAGPGGDDARQGRRARCACPLDRNAPEFAHRSAMTKPPPMDDSNNRIVAVTLDEESIGRSGPDIEHERAIAIYDLVEKNLFAPDGAEGGPFTLHLGITGNRLMFDIRREDATPVVAHLLSLTPFRRIVKDYFMICDSYYQAIRTATPDKIEAIDMGRRGIHDEGSRTLQERLKGKVRVDFETARRLFTLICVLHWKGEA